MSESLTQAINDMRTMREAYDELANAAEAYNAGKTELAQNITAKGVEASATETLPELAEKVSAIQQETIEIDGGGMFETQLYGAPTSVENVGGLYVQTGGALWNLYEVMAQLLSDGRFVQYGGIMLAEYFKGYDTIELMNVGAGGAYFTCDGDFYETDKTGANAHVWHDNNNGMMNRWVAYLFSGEYTNYTVPSTGLCPRSIHIGRKVGTIICSVAGRISEIVVQNGNELYGANFGSTQPWRKEVVIHNMDVRYSGLIRNNGNVVCVYMENTHLYKPLIYAPADSITSVYIGRNVTVTPWGCSNYTSVLSEGDNAWYVNHPPISYIYISEGFNWGTSLPLVRAWGGGTDPTYSFGVPLVIDGIKTLNSYIFYVDGSCRSNSAHTGLYMDTIETFNVNFYYSYHNSFPVMPYMKVVSAKKAKRNFSIVGGVWKVLEDVIVGEFEANLNLKGWNPTSIISDPDKVALINANIRDHIAANVSDRTGQTSLTFTVSTNLYNNLEQATKDAFTAKNWLVAGA